MRNKGLVLILVLAALLLIALVLGERLYGQGPPREAAVPTEEALLDAVMDRIGVTRWGEAMDWLEMEESGLLDGYEDAAQAPVWVSRDGHGAFHSNPLCSLAPKAPVKTTLALAQAAGRQPCGLCWQRQEAAN